MIDGGRLSAVARRRLLREAQDGHSSRGGSETGGSNVTSGTSTPAAPRTPPKVKETKATVSVEPLQELPGSNEDGARITSQNQFTPLVEAAAVKFHSTREIEQVGCRALKVRLERGQVRIPLRDSVITRCFLHHQVSSGLIMLLRNALY